MKKKFLLALATTFPFAALMTISCFNSDNRYHIQGSSLGQTINQALLQYMGYPSQTIDYQINSTIEKGVDSLQPKSTIYTMTTGQVVPLNEVWKNEQIRTMTIAKDEVVVLINLPEMSAIDEHKIKFNEQKLSDFYSNHLANITWKDLLISPSNQLEIKPQLLGRLNHEQTAGTAKVFFKYLERYNFKRENDVETSNLFIDDNTLFKAVQKTPHALTYISHAQAQRQLAQLKDEEKKHLKVVKLQDRLAMPINFLYQVNDKFAENLGMNLANQIFTPIFQELLQSKLYLKKLTGEEVMWQTNDAQVSIYTTDQQIKEQANPHLWFGLR